MNFDTVQLNPGHSLPTPSLPHTHAPSPDSTKEPIMPTIAPYGSWKSPITPDLIVQDSVGLGPVQLDGDDIYWVEMRPDEGARNVIVRRSPGRLNSGRKSAALQRQDPCARVRRTVLLGVRRRGLLRELRRPASVPTRAGRPAHSHHAGRGRSTVCRRDDRYASQSTRLRQRRPS